MMKDMTNTGCLGLYLWCFCVVVGLGVVSGNTPYIQSSAHNKNYHGNSLDIGDPRFHLDRSSLITYVIHRGCMYMSGFVRSHYVKDTKDDDKRFLLTQPSNLRIDQLSRQRIPQSNMPNDTDHPGNNVQYGPPFPGMPFPDFPQSQPGNPETRHGPPPDQVNNVDACGWQQFIGHMCDSFHVPKEFRDALVDCGMSYSMNSFSPLPATENMMHTCNISNSEAASTSSFIGKRNLIPLENQDEDISKWVESRDTEYEDGYDDADDSYGDGGLDDSRANIGNVGNITPLKRWCQSFSTKVRNSYHYSYKHAMKPSWYWVLDVYRNTNRYRLPKYYAHGLIGCGLKYAMYALHVPLRQTIVYTVHGL